jgi:hypothetical protein
LNLRPGEKLRCVTRNTWMSTMTVLGAPGEVYLLTHSVLRARFGFPTTSRVEQIDPDHPEDPAPFAAPARRTHVAGWHGDSPQWRYLCRVWALGAPAQPGLCAAGVAPAPDRSALNPKTPKPQNPKN